MKRFSLSLFTTTAVLLSANANAQAWLRDRANTQGQGVTLGDFQLHPAISAEVGYDSNFFNRAPSNSRFEGSGYPVVGTTTLRITPAFSITNWTLQRQLLSGDKNNATSEQPRVVFQAGASLGYSEFLTNAGPGDDKLGRNRQFNINGDVGLSFLPGRPWSFNITDTISRTAQPSLDPDPTFGLDRIDNKARAEVVYTKPGGLFDWRLGYSLGYTHFESDLYAQLRNLRHEVFTKGRWKFLPRSALLYDGNVQFINYTSAKRSLSDSTALQSRIGMSTLLTERLNALIMVGWAATFYQNQLDNFDSFIGQAELRYYLGGGADAPGGSTLQSVAVGFLRDYSNSYIGNFYQRNRGYVNLNALFAGRFYVSFDGGVAAIGYSPVIDPSNTSTDPSTIRTLTSSFTNIRIDASLFGEYRIRDWFGVNATIQYVSEFSKTKIPILTPSGSLDLNFNRVQALVGLRVFY